MRGDLGGQNKEGKKEREGGHSGWCIAIILHVWESETESSPVQGVPGLQDEFWVNRDYILRLGLKDQKNFGI